MNAIRRILGVAWIVLAIVAGYYLIVSQAIPQFESGNTGDLVPAIIYTFILTPIVSGGLLVFGWYALKGEYDEERL